MRYLIVDDHSVVREGVAALLRQSATDVEIFHAGDYAAALKVLADQPDIDILFLDLMLPDVGGLDALRSLGERYPGLPVVILSSSQDPGDAHRALAMGALGYVPKTTNTATFLAALRLILAGGIYVPPFAIAERQHVAPRHALAALTDRQIEVLECLQTGIGNKQIAHRLGISEKTVKAHVGAILRALGVSSRTEAARIARQHQ